MLRPCAWSLAVAPLTLVAQPIVSGPVVTDAAITSIFNIAPLLCDVDTVYPIVTLKNNGSVPLNSVIIEAEIDGSAPVFQPWTGDLQPGQTVTIELGALAAGTGDRTLIVTSAQPNGILDDEPGNDDWSITYTASSPAGQLALVLTLDAMGSDITWELRSPGDLLLYEGGPYPDGQEGLVDSIGFCLTNGCYVFSIHDAFGNGLCCAEGNGRYEVKDLYGVVHVSSDGVFEELETTEFCLVDVGVPEHRSLDLAIAPNPSTGPIHITTSPTQAPALFTLLDPTWRSIRTGTLSAGGSTELDLTGYAAGLYVLVVHSGEARYQRRLVLDR